MIVEIIYRSNHQRCSIKKGVLRNFAKFTGKHLCQSLFFNKVAGLRPATLLKKRLWHRCFPVNFAKFLCLWTVASICKTYEIIVSLLLLFTVFIFVLLLHFEHYLQCQRH